MSVERAIEMLKQAKDVNNWNEIREYIKLQVTEQEWVKSYVLPVDASGLIVSVLGKD